jgi:PAS domain S-box-containing protein
MPCCARGRELENTFNSLTDFVVVADEEGRLVHVNRAFLDRIGRPKQELIDHRLADIVGAKINEQIARAKDSEGLVDGEGR